MNEKNNNSTEEFKSYVIKDEMWNTICNDTIKHVSLHNKTNLLYSEIQSLQPQVKTNTVEYTTELQQKLQTMCKRHMIIKDLLSNIFKIFVKK